MYDFYTSGATLEEVGVRFGLTRERVRQVFQEANLPTRTIAETQSLRNRRLAEERADDICAAFEDCRDIAEVARKLNISRVVVGTVVKDRFPPSLRRRPRNVPPKYPTVDLIALLRQAGSTRPGVLTSDAYRRYAADRETDGGPHWPSTYTYIKRFGSWREALRSAGLPAHRPTQARSRRKFSNGDCVRALRESAQTLEGAPTMSAYSDLARASDGRLPSAMTITNRLGTWHNALSKAGL